MAHMHTPPHGASVQFESPDCDFFVIHMIKCKSKSLETLPGGQTAVCHLDVARFSATTRSGSRLK